MGFKSDAQRKAVMAKLDEEKQKTYRSETKYYDKDKEEPKKEDKPEESKEDKEE